MAYIDYYKILGISKNASEKDIKKAYRKLARKHHPDVNPNDKDAEQRFKEINEANEVLSNPENRKKYDEYGKDWKHAEQFEAAKKQQGQSRSGRTTSSQGDFSESEFSDFFESMFGGRGGFSAGQGRRSQPAFKGQDFHAEMDLPLREVYTTHKRTLTVNGKNIRLTIPAGVKNGQVIKIKGYGGPGANGGPAGDLHIRFNIADDPKFKREGKNLYRSVDIDLYTAVLGGELTVDTMKGKVKVKVKPGTKNGSKVKLSGKGFPVYKKEGEFGDLYLTLLIEIPQDLSTKEKEMFEELRKLRSS
jgi:curved DNA-binding protein